MANINTYEGKQEALADSQFRTKIQIARLQAAQAIYNEGSQTAIGPKLERYLFARVVLNRPDQFGSQDIQVINALQDDAEHTTLSDATIFAAVSATWDTIAAGLDL